jgi:gluconolactonase
MFGEIDGAGIEVLHPSFNHCLTGHGRVERLWTGGRWLEGPVWFGAGRYLLFSDIPNNRMLRWDETDGGVSVFRDPSYFSNGNTRDLEGRLITCEHLSRSVTRTEHCGSRTVLVNHYQGKLLNSPNDVVVKSDGTIWFTDPDYGILSDYEGQKAASEQDSCGIYKYDPNNNELVRISGQLTKPNGLCFNTSEKALFVSDSGASHMPNGPKALLRFSCDKSGNVPDKPELFAECTEGLFDGFRIDTDDRIWTSARACGSCCQSPGGLLLHRFTLTHADMGGFFCGAFRRVTPPGRYPAPLLCGVRTFLGEYPAAIHLCLYTICMMSDHA